jgi:phenylacetate 2-hydroxylase
VRLIPRDRNVLEDCLHAAQERTREHYKEDIKGFATDQA